MQEKRIGNPLYQKFEMPFGTSRTAKLNLNKVSSFVKNLDYNTDKALINKLRAFGDATFSKFDNLLTSNSFNFDASKFVTVLKRADNIPTSVNDLDDIVDLVVSSNLTTKELLDGLAEMQTKNFTGFSNVASEICCESWGKYIGSIKVLKVVFKERREFLNEALEFEKYVSSISGSGGRYYDIAFSIGNGLFKYIEVKSWKNFNATTFNAQFIKDLQNIKQFGQLGWIFDSKLTFVLKDQVINTLKANKANVLTLGKDKVKELLGNSNLDVSSITDDNFADILIQNLENETIFNSIFKVQ